MSIDRIVGAAHRAARELHDDRALLVGLSGIDGSGKTHLAARLGLALEGLGLRVAALSADDWLSLPAVRFSAHDPAGNFYRQGLRLDAMYRDLVVPLRDRRRIDVRADFLAEKADDFHRIRIVHESIDVVLVEGIFLFKRRYQRLFDLALWADCAFETALERAVARRQEGLGPEETAAIYRRIYFPAQRIHLRRDDPMAASHHVITNDHRPPSCAGRSASAGGFRS